MCLVLLIFCMRSVSVMSGDIAYFNSLHSKTDRINATVITAPININDSGYGCCTIRVNWSSQGHLKKGDKLYYYADGIINSEIGDLLESDVSYSAFDKEYAASHYSEGVYLSATCDGKMFSVGKDTGIYGLAGNIRRFIKTRIMSCSDNYHILLSIITGERCYISDELYGRVIDAGVSHVLVVSGMHLVLLCGGLERILKLIFRREVLSDLFLLLFVLLMSAVCGFGMSILRAAIVYFLRVLYRRIGRRTNGVHLLSMAATAVLLIHPYAFHSVSFQLSYSATFGILVLSRPINKRLNKYYKGGAIYNYISKAMSISLSAYIATLPVCIAAFGEISLVAIPVNIILDVPASAMLAICIMGIAFGFVPFIERLFISLADALGDYFLKIVNFVSGLPFCKLELRNAETLAVVVLLFYFALYIAKTKSYRIFMKR